MNKKIITYAISAFTICGGLFFSGTNAIQYDISPIRVGTKDVAYSIENLNGIGTFFATTEYSGVYFYWSLYNTTNPNVTTLYEITDPLKNTFTGSITGTVGSDEIEFGITPFHRNEYNYKDTPHRVNGDYKVDIKLLSGDEVLNTTGATITGLKFASIELFGEKHQSLNNLSFQINWKHELAPVSIRELSGTCQLIIDNEEHLCYTTNHLNNWDDGFEDVDIVIDENKISHNEGTGYIKMDILNRRYEPIDSDTLYFTYNNNTETTYTVKHYKQGVNGFYSTTPDESETFTGLVDDIVTPPTETYTGFTSPNTQTGIILPDGGLTINYYYTRNSYTVTYDTAGGDPIPSTGVLFEASIPTPTPSKNGFSFNTWLGLPSGGKMPATGITLTADWIGNTNPGDPSTPEQTIASYTVKHYKQSVNGLYSFSPDESETFTGLVGDIVTPNVKSYTGFTSPSTKSGTILSGGELTINYLYTRNSYTVTYDTAGGDPIPSTGVLFEASIPTPTPSKEGYSFHTWLGLPSGGKMPATGITLTADWIGNTNPGDPSTPEQTIASYTVKHYKQGINGFYSFSPDESETFTGLVGDIVTPNVKSYTGFTSPSTKSGTILSGGELTINYLYTRNSYTVTYDTAGGDPIPSTGVLFEASIPTPTPSKNGFSFNTWLGLPSGGKMPATGITLTADWTESTNPGGDPSTPEQTIASYTVKHYKQGINGNDWSLADTDNFTGIVDDIVTPPTKTYIGFTSPNTQTGAILSGGELTINYYYTRNTYTVSYNSNGGDSIPSKNVMFEGIIPTPTPSKAGYSFNGWFGLPTSGLMPANDITLTANWTANSGGGNGSSNSSSSSSSKGGSSGKSHSSGETQNKTGTTISSGTIIQHVNAATGENYTMKYISRSCKPYNIEYIPELNAYTSPDLKKKEYFVNFDYLKRYVDSKNAQNAECYIERTWVTTGYIDMNDYTDRYIAPNGKIYFINEKNGYYMSSQLSSPKTFETIGELKKYIKDRNPLTSMLIYPKPSATPREFGNMSLKNSSSTNGITTNTIDNKKDEDALSELRNELLSD